MRYRRSGRSNWYKDLNTGEMLRLAKAEAKRRNKISDTLLELFAPTEQPIPSLTAAPDLERLWRRSGRSNWFSRRLPSGETVKQQLSWREAAKRNTLIETGIRKGSEKAARRAGAKRTLTPAVFNKKRPIGDTFVKIYERGADGNYHIVSQQIVSPDQFFRVFKPYMKPSGLMLTGYYAYSVEPIEME